MNPLKTSNPVDQASALLRTAIGILDNTIKTAELVSLAKTDAPLSWTPGITVQDLQNASKLAAKAYTLAIPTAHFLLERGEGVENAVPTVLTAIQRHTIYGTNSNIAQRVLQDLKSGRADTSQHDSLDPTMLKVMQVVLKTVYSMSLLS